MKKTVKTILLAASLSALSQTVHAGCTVFQHIDYKGARWHLRGGSILAGIANPNPRNGASCSGPRCPTIHWQPRWNDQISSFTVTPDCEINMYQHVDGSTYPPRGYGLTWRAHASTPWVGQQWNDQISLVVCNCRR